MEATNAAPPNFLMMVCAGSIEMDCSDIHYDMQAAALGNVANCITDGSRGLRYGSAMDMSKWVAQALEHKGWSQAELGRQLTTYLRRDIDRAAVNKMVGAKRGVAADEALAISTLTGLPLPSTDIAEASPPQSTVAERLIEARKRRAFESAEAAAGHFGWPPTVYAAHEDGTRNIQRSKLLEYSGAFRVSLKWLLTGASGPDVVEVTGSIPVVGEVAAGLWREEEVWDSSKYPDIPRVPGRYDSLDQRAYRVSGPSVDKLRIFDGDFVITVWYEDVRSSITDGDVVVVQRRNGSLTEYTVKQVETQIPDGRVLLWPRSTDPKFTDPIVVPIGDSGCDDNHVAVIALVIGTYRPIG